MWHANETPDWSMDARALENEKCYIFEIPLNIELYCSLFSTIMNIKCVCGAHFQALNILLEPVCN